MSNFIPSLQEITFRIICFLIPHFPVTNSNQQGYKEYAERDGSPYSNTHSWENIEIVCIILWFACHHGLHFSLKRLYFSPWNLRPWNKRLRLIVTNVKWQIIDIRSPIERTKWYGWWDLSCLKTRTGFPNLCTRLLQQPSTPPNPAPTVQARNLPHLCIIGTCINGRILKIYCWSSNGVTYVRRCESGGCRWLVRHGGSNW